MDVGSCLLMVGPDLSGAVLDSRYRLVSLLGAGGMGQIYEGTHLSLDRRVAVKVLPSHLSEEARFRARFAREARAAAKITHRNVVQIMDYGESPDGPVYFVMEFFEGRDLRALLREEGRLPWPRARGLLLQAVSALKAAHAHGIIHRDIKPGNCFLVDLPHEGLTSVVKLLDFGIAKVLTEIESEGGTLLKPLTATGEIVGTASYMAPEQARCEHLDARSDVYSLGIMAYEMLTGRVPFSGINPFHVVTRHLFERPDPLHHSVPDIDPEVEALVLRAIAKEPAERFQSMAELEAAIVAIESMGVESARTRVRLVVGTAERLGREKSGPANGKPEHPTVVLHEPETKAEPRVSDDSFEDAETPDPLVLMPRFGEPYPLEAREDGEPSDPALPEEDELVEPSEEAQPTRVRLAPEPADECSSAPTPTAATERTVAELPSLVAPLVHAPEPTPAPEDIDASVEPEMAAPVVDLPVPPRHEAAESRSRNDASLGRTRSTKRSWLLGLVLLLSGGGGIAAMAMSDEQEDRPAAMATSTAEYEPAKPTPPGSETGVTAETKSMSNARRAAPEPSGNEAPALVGSQEGKGIADASASTDATGEPDDETPVPPVAEAQPDASPAKATAPPAKRKPYESDACKEHRKFTEQANDAGEHSRVAQLTLDRACWPPSQRIVRLRMRLNALSETGRFTECVDEGRDIRDEKIVKIAGFCKKQLK